MPAIYVVKHLLCRNCISLGVDDQEFLYTREAILPDPNMINRLTRIVEARDLCPECLMRLPETYQGKVPMFHPIQNLLRSGNTSHQGCETRSN
jgi:hypothetical protein